MSGENFSLSVSIPIRATNDSASAFGVDAGKLADNLEKIVNKTTNGVVNAASLESSTTKSEFSTLNKLVSMPEPTDSKVEVGRDKKKEQSEDINFAEKNSTDLLQGIFFNTITEPIVFSGMNSSGSVGDEPKNNNASAVWISGGQQNGTFSTYQEINVKKFKRILYRLSIFSILVIASLIVLGKI
jgi:hypothetical protein